MSERLQLPAHVFTDKAKFSTRPGREVLKEIKDFIEKTGEPHMWWGHSHSKPGRNDRIVYLDTFDLPSSHRGEGNRDRWAPCPCCHLHYPKYYRGGMIAWFSDQKLIRILGPQCFKRLNPEGHEAAYRQYTREQKIRRDIGFLLQHMPLLPDAMKAIRRGIEIADAVDPLRNALSNRIDDVLEAPGFWHHVRDGSLKITKRKVEMREREDGSEYEHETGEIVVFRHLPGYHMLQPRARSIARQLRYALTSLMSIEAYAQVNPLNLTDKERYEIARVFERALKQAEKAWTEIETVRQFLGPLGMANFSAWGREPGAPVNFHARLEGRTLQLGRSEYDYQRSDIPSDFFGVLPRLPRISAVNLDDVPEVHLDAPKKNESDVA